MVAEKKEGPNKIFKISEIMKMLRKFHKFLRIRKIEKKCFKFLTFKKRSMEEESRLML